MKNILMSPYSVVVILILIVIGIVSLLRSRGNLIDSRFENEDHWPVDRLSAFGLIIYPHMYDLLVRPHKQDVYAITRSYSSTLEEVVERIVSRVHSMFKQKDFRVALGKRLIQNRQTIDRVSNERTYSQFVLAQLRYFREPIWKTNAVLNGEYEMRYGDVVTFDAYSLDDDPIRSLVMCFGIDPSSEFQDIDGNTHNLLDTLVEVIEQIRK